MSQFIFILPAIHRYHPRASASVSASTFAIAKEHFILLARTIRILAVDLHTRPRIAIEVQVIIVASAAGIEAIDDYAIWCALKSACKSVLLVNGFGAAI
jgi:hypothetical protein